MNRLNDRCHPLTPCVYACFLFITECTEKERNRLPACLPVSAQISSFDRYNRFDPLWAVSNSISHHRDGFFRLLGVPVMSTKHVNTVSQIPRIELQNAYHLYRHINFFILYSIWY